MTMLQLTLAGIGAVVAFTGFMVMVWVLAFACGRAFTLGRLTAARKWNEMRRKNGRNRP